MYKKNISSSISNAKVIIFPLLNSISKFKSLPDIVDASSLTYFRDSKTLASMEENIVYFQLLLLILSNQLSKDAKLLEKIAKELKTADDNIKKKAELK